MSCSFYTLPKAYQRNLWPYRIHLGLSKVAYRLFLTWLSPTPSAQHLQPFSAQNFRFQWHWICCRAYVCTMLYHMSVYLLRGCAVPGMAFLTSIPNFQTSKLPCLFPAYYLSLHPDSPPRDICLMQPSLHKATLICDPQVLSPPLFSHHNYHDLINLIICSCICLGPYYPSL